MVTKQGCMIYAERYPKLETAAEFRRQNDFSWEGSGCEKGKILNGEGTMTETFVGNVDVRKGGWSMASSTVPPP